jgi:hypothetical protein
LGDGSIRRHPSPDVIPEGFDLEGRLRRMGRITKFALAFGVISATGSWTNVVMNLWRWMHGS